jgi:hypothetical protein
MARAQSLLHTQLAVSSQALDIKGGVYRTTIPMSGLQVPLARIVDLDQERGLRPLLKLYGIGLPSYRSGWYRLRDGEKALVALTRTNRVVYIPTSQGYALLLSPDNPTEFLAALHTPPVNGQVFSIEKRAGAH